MEKARGEPSAPFISGAAWNLPSPRVPPLGQRCWLTPISGEQRGVIPALPAWSYKAQHALQPWQHPSFPSAPSCCPAPQAGHQPASRHHLSTVQEVWWEGPPASPTDESQGRMCLQNALSLIHPLWSSQKTLPEDLTFHCLP